MSIATANSAPHADAKAAIRAHPVPTVDAATLQQWLHDGGEIALLDVREHGQYGEGHPFFAVHLPYSRLEPEVARLVPRRATRTVLLDDGASGVAARAAARLAALGYDKVWLLAGGAPAWARAGHTLFQGVNLPSKTFGERVEHAFDVPHIGAQALAARLQSGEPLVLLDGRTLEEHRRMTIPGALPVPNGELALRWRTLVPDDQTPIVVHCAGVPLLDAAAAQAWLDDDARTTFVFDVRTADEFAAGSVPGARHAPGGQLLQAVDLQIGVRGSRVLLLDDEGIRAPVVALWLRRLGLDAALVQGGIAAALRIPSSPRLPLPLAVPEQIPEALAALRGDGNLPPVVFDLRPSMAYRQRHARGAAWSIRPRLVADVQAATRGDRQRPVLLLAAEEIVARLAAQDLREAGWHHLSWAPALAAKAAGWPQDASSDSPADADAIDYLFFVHDRHEGNLDAARRYLAWETGLIAQCAPEDLAAFRLPEATHIDI